MGGTVEFHIGVHAIVRWPPCLVCTISMVLARAFGTLIGHLGAGDSGFSGIGASHHGYPGHSLPVFVVLGMESAKALSGYFHLNAICRTFK